MNHQRLILIHGKFQEWKQDNKQNNIDKMLIADCWLCRWRLSETPTWWLQVCPRQTATNTPLRSPTCPSTSSAPWEASTCGTCRTFPSGSASGSTQVSVAEAPSPNTCVCWRGTTITNSGGEHDRASMLYLRSVEIILGCLGLSLSGVFQLTAVSHDRPRERWLTQSRGYAQPLL